MYALSQNVLTLNSFPNWMAYSLFGPMWFSSAVNHPMKAASVPVPSQFTSVGGVQEPFGFPSVAVYPQFVSAVFDAMKFGILNTVRMTFVPEPNFVSHVSIFEKSQPAVVALLHGAVPDLPFAVSISAQPVAVSQSLTVGKPPGKF